MDAKRTEFLIFSAGKLRLLLGVAALGVLLAGWELYRLGMPDQGDEGQGAELSELRAEQSRLLEQVDRLETLNAELERKLALTEHSRKLDAEAYALFNQERSGLQDQLQGLQEELAFYRGIMSPDKSKVGIEARDFDLKPARGAGRYRFSFMLTQSSGKEQLARGVVRISVEGVLDGKSKQLTLSELTQSGDSEFAYRFRYFQAIKGELQLPEGFDAERVVIKAIPTSAPKLPLEWIFDWPSDVTGVIGAAGKTEEE
ncbi:MAG: hypothetical protein KKA36_05960 [Gammaproteobacteria bacterium]|nr:hypothetical protein [Gammaproteobacteria bacterium]